MGKRKLLFAIFFAILLLSSCASVVVENKAESENYYTFTDHLGNNVELKQKPQRTAVLLSSFADIWTTAGGDVPITVGESVERGFADDEALLVDDGAGKTIDNELLISYEPDLVICSSDIAAQLETAELMRSSGIPCAVLRVETFEDYLDVLKIFTDIMGTPENYREYGVNVENRINELLSSIDGKNTEEKKILFIRSGSKQSSAKAKVAENHFACAMLKELGTYNIAETAPVLLDGLSIEEILTEDPEYIFISTMGDELAAKKYMDSVLESEEWSSLTAVQNGNYCYLPKELFQYKPNSRWAEAYEYLIELLYSETKYEE